MADTTRIQGDREISTDIFAEILSWLPAISLLKSKLVCKSWRQLISSPEFVPMHLNSSKESPNGTRVLISSPCRVTNHNHAFGLHSSTYKPLIYHPLAKDVQIIGSCDGLICFFNKDSRQVSVRNPSTGKSITAVLECDSHRDGIPCCWFGRHPVDREYVFLIGKYLNGNDNLCAEIEVYNFSSKSSNLLPLYSCSIPHKDFKDEFFEETGTLMHATLHWPAKRQPRQNAPGVKIEWTSIIITYDFRKNEVIEIPAPPTGECLPFTLGVVDGCIFAIFGRSREVFELWIMKEYGVKESWTMHGRIDGDIVSNKTIMTPLGFCQNGDPILTVDGLIRKYRFIDKKQRGFLMIYRSDFSKAIGCPDSLVDPELINSGK